MIRLRCPCGWAKPMVAVTTATGDLPQGELVVRVICPGCERGYTAGERSLEEISPALEVLGEGMVIR